MENTQSYWLASTPETNYPSLGSGLTVDVAVLGGGLAGLATAHLLKQAGVRVALIEANRIGQGTTGHTTAKITAQHDLIYAELIKNFGREKAQQYADANNTALKTMAEIIQAQGIECDFQTKPAYVYTEQESFIKKIAEEAEAASSLGLAAVLDPNPDLPFSVKAAMRFDGQAQFHPRKFALAVAQAFPGGGCEIYENTPVADIEEGRINTITTAAGAKVKADKVVLATHFPFHDANGFYFARMYAVRSYVLGVRAAGPLPAGMYITAEQPGRSIRTQPTPEGDLLLVGGEHHRTGVGKEWTHYQRLEEFAHTNFNVNSIPYRWSAQDYTTADKVPYIGFINKGRENMFVATGFRKWGITTSVAAALIIRDLLLTGSSPWQDVFNPQRFANLGSAGKLAGMNFEVATELVGGKLTKPAPSQVGDAWVESSFGKKIGFYRDAQGALHKVDLTCTHKGCEVQWNSAEKTWDCPCHGSRYTPDGEIVSGPAVEPLKIPED